MIKALIMAGGIGERLWPMSTGEKPKQFHSFGSDKSMIEETINRLNNIVDDVLIVTTKNQVPLFRELLPDFPEEKIVREPFGRNTTPAVALGSMYYEKEDIMVVVPSDHVIKDMNEYEMTMKNAIVEANENQVLITIGITPTEPNTGYGYIERGEAFNKDAGSYSVKRFHEKPSLDIAEKYFSRGDFYWNSGMFVWKKETFEKALKEYVPEIYNGLKKLEEDPSKINDIYEAFPKISLDYGIMEKSTNTLVIPASFYWNDIGSWDSVYEMEEKDEVFNVVRGKFIINNVRGSLLINDTDKPYGLSGLEDMIVVVSKNGTLICERGNSQSVREITKELG